jgi:Domain of unknown function (DUF4177)
MIDDAGAGLASLRQWSRAPQNVVDHGPDDVKQREKEHSMTTTSYEYKFVRLGEGRFSVRKVAGETYQEVVHQHARDGWRLVQIFAPNLYFATAKYYELVFERAPA